MKRLGIHIKWSVGQAMDERSRGIGEGGGKEVARHTRVVYINNQRVELEAEAAS